jgi:xanthine dehydrogenase molybdenum-binding subunit
MVFLKVLGSPMPHARVTAIDDSAALAMPGVHGVLKADEIETNPPAPQETILTNEPLFVGHPILAVAADTEELASDALEKIKVTYEELPFTVDPLQSLYPGGPNARTNGNSMAGPELRNVKWTAQDFAAVQEGQLPQGAPARNGRSAISTRGSPRRRSCSTRRS